ncbi:hypothetical protein Tco_1442211, partial [Tanacetum coccineum]
SYYHPVESELPSTSHPLLLPSPIVLPHTRASVAMMRAAAPSNYILASRSDTPPSGTPPLLHIPLPTPSPPFLLPSTDCHESSSASTARPTGGFRADYGFVGTLDDEIRRDPRREVGYGITDTWDEMVEDMQGTPAVTDLAGRLDDAKDDRSLMSDQLNMLRSYRRAHARTVRLIKSEARLSREAWVLSMDASDTAHSESQQIPAREPARPEILEEAVHKMAPKRTTRSTPATTTTPTTSVTDEQLKRLIDQGVDDALAARDADRS